MTKASTPKPHRRALCLTLIVLCVAGGAAGGEAGAVEVALISAPDDEHFGTVEIRGLSRGTLQHLAEISAGANFSWTDRFPVYTGTEPPDDHPAMLGSYRIESDRVRFIPRFPLLAGQPYCARWRASTQQDWQIEARFSLPAATFGRASTTEVVAIYPSAAALPANLLKLYLQFSAPMSRGEAYDHLRLLRADGSEVQLPFVAPHHELWNATTDRLTLFFDPGRIKRGVAPNTTVGPPLRAGESYRLVIDPGWPDARGLPLREGFEKSFRVVEADRKPPAVEGWRLDPPAGDTALLTIDFPEALDHALLARMLEVLDAQDETVAGTVEVSAGARRWTFRPARPWRPGPYRIRVDTRLEDLAGNSLRRAFESRLDEPGRVEPTLLLEFAVGSP